MHTLGTKRRIHIPRVLHKSQVFSCLVSDLGHQYHVIDHEVLCVYCTICCITPQSCPRICGRIRLRIAILGAGGTARAAIGALKGTGSEVTILTRSMIRHDQLHAAAGDLQISFLDWLRFEEIQDRDLIISTTPAGATDGLSVISSKADFFEVIYHPWPTELAKRYQNLGKKVVGGLALLVEQALFQIKYFSQTDFDFDQMRQSLLKVGYEAIKK